MDKINVGVDASIGGTESSFVDGFDPIRFFHVLKKSVILLIVIIPMVMLAAFLYARYTKPVYRSSSVIKLKINNEVSDLGFRFASAKNNNLNNLAGEIEIIRSRVIVDELIGRLGLTESYFEYGKVLNDEKFRATPFYIEYDSKDPSIVYNKAIDITFNTNSEYKARYLRADGEAVEKLGVVGQKINLAGFQFVLRRSDRFTSKNVKVPYFFKINSVSYIHSYMQERLSVSILNPKANTIEIAFQDNNAQKAVAIVNAIDEIYLEKTLENKRQEQDQVIKFINEQLESTAKSLENSEIQLEEFVKESGTLDPNSDFGLIKGRLDELTEEKIQLKLESDFLDEIKNLILSSSESKFITVSSLESNPQLNQEVSRLNESYKELDRSKSTTNTNTLAYKNRLREVQTLENSVLEYVFESRKILNSKVLDVNEKIQGLHDEFLGLPSKETELTRLRRFYNLWEKFYLMLIEKRVEYGIMKAGTTPEFVVLSRASQPGTLIYPVKIRIYALGLILGLVISFLVIATKYVLHNKIVTPKELEKSLIPPVLGMIPKFRRKKLEFSSLVVDNYPKSSVTEALRSIRTNVEFISPGKDKRIVSVTSTISGEGKTFFAINLGGVLAVGGQRVMVIDLDMRKPKLHLGFDGENIKGMSTLLIGKHSLEDCIQHSKMDGLDYISAGSLPPNPSELIMLDKLDEIFDLLHQSYDVVIVDTPPVGLVTDGLLVMKRADIPLYVVRSGYSHRDVYKTINTLYKSGRYEHLSVVLNGVDSGIGYGYGYGDNGYGYYDES